VTPHGEKLRRFQYTAIDDATRIRALQIYERHNQDSAIDEPRGARLDVDVLLAYTDDVELEQKLDEWERFSP
jgi:hypothetical protein